MRFFGKGEEKEKDKEKDEPKPEAKKDAATESQRLAAKAEASRKVEVKKGSPLRTFVVGLIPHEKLGLVSPERFEEGLRAALPKGTRVQRITGPDPLTEGPVALTRAPGEGAVRLYELEGALDVNETILLLQEKGLLEGQVDLGLDRAVVLFRATGRLAALSGAAELVDRFGFKYEMRCESHEVFVQYPPSDVHKRWLADDDYRAAYQRWRTQRSEDARTGRWHSGWPASTGDEAGPPWVRLRAKDGKPDEYALEFDEKILLRFSFQAAEIKIMRFNLKILSNKLTNEFSTYRNLPLSLESLPKEVQDRLNREPEKYRALREPGKFGASFDLVRRAYEDLGGEYFQLDRVVAPPASSSSSGALPKVTPPPSSQPPVPPPPLTSESTEHWSEANGHAPDPRDLLPTDSRDGEPPAPLPPATPSGSSKTQTSSTLRGGVRKSDVGLALPTAPKKPEGGEAR